LGRGWLGTIKGRVCVRGEFDRSEGAECDGAGGLVGRRERVCVMGVWGWILRGCEAGFALGCIRLYLLFGMVLMLVDRIVGFRLVHGS
jgi:hypothetical protein